MNKKNRKTLQRIFDKPTRSDVSWSETRSLLLALDAVVIQGDDVVRHEEAAVP